jgi:RNA polymerase primary sigma factor
MANLNAPEDLKAYLLEINSLPPLTKQEQTDLLRKIKEGEVANKRLIEGYLALVVSIAERHSSSGVPMLDLMQEGNVGLIIGIRRFSGSSEAFAADAAASIERAVLNRIAEFKTSSE